MSKFHAEVKGKKIVFHTDFGESLFYEKMEGKPVVIESTDKASAKMHRFYRGAVLPYNLLQNTRWSDVKEVHDALKAEFLGSYFFTDIKGRKRETTISLAGVSRVKLSKYIEDILNWMGEQGLEVPDSEEFLKWQDSAPPAGSEYPPLRRLREAYEAKKNTKTPWRV